MLTSLFGDLLASRDAKAKSSDFEDTQVVNSSPDFAATAIMESIATEVNERGQIIDRHVSDLVVTGSPAQAIREHFATTRADLETATSMITLLDPVGVWASSVVKALSDAGGRPIEKLHLREHTTLRTIAMIERTMLVRRNEDTLRIFHADVRAPGPENAEIPVALMERSQMTAVIIGPMQPHAIDALLASLRHATSLPTWRCPHLLFQLPPNASWIDDKVHAIAWPERLHVHIVSEPMTGASSVWNAMLNVWNEARLEPGWDPTAVSPMLGTSDFPIKVGELDPKVAASAKRRRRARRPAAAATTGARRARRGAQPPGACQLAQARRPARLRAGRCRDRPRPGARGTRPGNDRHGARRGGLRAGACQPSRRRADHRARRSDRRNHHDRRLAPRADPLAAASRRPVLVALLEKHRTNLALARFQLLEVERALP